MKPDLLEVYLLDDRSSEYQPKNNHLSSIQTAFFRVLNDLPEGSAPPTASHLTWRTVEVLVRTLNLVSLLYHENETVADWGDTSRVWKLLSFTRVDLLCCRFAAIAFWVVFIAAAGALCLSAMIFLLAQEIRSHTHSRRLSRNLCFPLLRVISRLIFIPSVSTSVALTKLSILQQAEMTEYCTMPIAEIGPGEEIIILAIGAFVAVLLGAIDAAFLAAVSLDPAAQGSAVCSHSRVQVYEKAAITVLIVLHFSLLEVHWIVYKSIFCGISLFIGGLTLYLLPYHSRYFNCLHIAQWAITGLCSSAFLFGYLIDSGSVTLALCLVLTPPALVFVGVAVQEREKALNSVVPVRASASLLVEELRIRWRVEKQGSAPDSIYSLLPLYSQLTSIHPTSKLAVIWETRFCLDFLKDERLARIKLSKALTCSSNIVDDFQEFRLRERLSPEHCEYQEEVDFMRFQTLLEQVRRSDEQFCFLLLSFWSEVSAKTLNWSRLERLITRIDATMKDLNSFYSSVTHEYPRSPSGLRLFGTFLRDLCNEQQRAERVLKKAESELTLHVRAARSEESSQQFTYFNETNGLMIISGAQGAFGTITFANVEAAHTLGYPSVESMIGMDINAIVPPPFSFNHHVHMRRFLRTCTSSTIQLPFTVFMKKMNGNIVEVYASMKCTALHSEPFFIVAMRMRPVTREVALVSSAKKVHVHTDGFPEVLTGDYANLQGRHLNSIIPLFSAIHSNKRLFHPFRAKSLHADCTLVLARSTINHVDIDILMVLTDNSEHRRWQGEGKEREKRMLSYASDTVPINTGSQTHLLSSQGLKPEDYGPMGKRTATHRVSYVDQKAVANDSPKHAEKAQPQSLGNGPNTTKTDHTSFASVILTLQRKSPENLAFPNVQKQTALSLRSLRLLLYALTSVVLAFNITVAVFTASFAATDNPAALELLEVSYWLATLSDAARELQLTGSASASQARICNATLYLENFHTKLIDDYTEFAAPADNVGMQFPVWSILSETYILRDMEHAVGELVNHSPSLQYLHRNAVAEHLRAGNTTGSAQIALAVSAAHSFVARLYVVYASFAACVALCCVLAVPALTSLQRSSTRVWSFFLSMQLAKVLEAKAKCIDRLEREHGHELQPISSPHVRATRTHTSAPAVWLGVVAKTCIFLAASAAWYYGLEQLAATALAGTRVQYWKTTHELMQVRTLFRLSALWLLETTADSGLMSYGNETRYGQAFVGAEYALRETAVEIQMRRRRLFSRLISGEMDGEYECQALVPELKIELRAEESTTLLDLFTVTAVPSISRLRAVITSIEDCQMQRISALKDATRRTEQRALLQIAAVVVLHCVVTVAVLILLCKYDVRRIQRRIKKVWKISKLVSASQ